ncbi:MAG: 4-phosphopantetheinyl transferase superfamily protein [Mucilaginibacter sp.]|nr:4-phosphopantetheinyl transferase superfamily protein [Mucilaginibacter sp.]
MKSAGNDIVALKTIDIQRTNSPVFYSKFITVTEQELYQQPQFAAVTFECYIWLLWSVKESVYKYLKRADAGLVFSPTKIKIKNINTPLTQPVFGLNGKVWESDHAIEDFYTGEVLYGSQNLYFRSKVDTEFIASVVSSSLNFNGVYWGIQYIDTPDYINQSTQVRLFLLKKLKSVLAVDELKIEKSLSGYPVVLQGDMLLDIPVSFAHHHQFISYSFLLE